jgi:signal transduction histidine kinase
MLHEFVDANREVILTRARTIVASRPWPPASTEELYAGIPLFLTQLAGSLRQANAADSTDEDSAIGPSASLHGGQLLSMGFTISQVVHGYGDICQSITSLAIETEASISTEEFKILNRCLDTAIAESVTEYARLREEAAARLESERLGQVAHELRNKLHTAMLAFHVLQSGTVGVNGSTGAVLGRSLLGLKELADSTLAEVRLAAAHPRRERLQLKAFVDELVLTASLHAHYHAITFKVAPVDPGLMVAVDLPLLTSAVTNLLQNAFKYTKEHSTVTLRTRGEDGHVFLEVEDECGGMPVPPGTDPFRAPRVPRADGRSGLGLGLSICRKAVEANGGRVRTRNLPGRGCIFEIELPAAVLEPAPAAVPAV